MKVTLNFDKATESFINMFLMHKSKWSKNTIHSRSVFIQNVIQMNEPNFGCFVFQETSEND